MRCSIPRSVFTSHERYVQAMMGHDLRNVALGDSVIVGVIIEHIDRNLYGRGQLLTVAP